ncbi:hypothetical protein EXIGLDRAFT_632649 [Exidia glandulosa HHB12029]|uniref:Uncharacterized protein n=1 Tax=Exidia glandulosa HHB12029 TaxID=1314781 RepID=A0A166NFR9_EXIGL|nr:hypothetical protein EXIGLDRAFT_632649 [Exidia glandulosa HHB12029]
MRPSAVVGLANIDRQKIARHLSVRFSSSAQAVLPLVPQSIEVWGKVRRLDGGDTIHAFKVVKMRPDSRDATFVRYSLDVDRFAHRARWESDFETRAFFGQLQRIFVLPLPPLPQYAQSESQVILLAEVRQCAGVSQPKADGPYYYNGSLGVPEVIDLACIECLIGRVEDRGQWGIVDRSNALSRVLMPED